VLIDGPWVHREVRANGARFHVAEAGAGPLVLLLHGFPQFWWAWRGQLPDLAAAGFRAVAVDLRGFGASDKPPKGYDGYTLSADVAGLVRALGETDAVLVGHGIGGILAWAAAGLHPQVVRRLVVLAAPHPVRQRAAYLTNPDQLRSSGYAFGFQVPFLPEHRLTLNSAAAVGDLLRRWSGPGYPPAPVEERYREAMLIPGVAQCAVEYYRWAIRSLVRPSGMRLLRILSEPLPIATLQLHGSLDSCLRPATALGSGRYVGERYEWREIPGAGHFLPEEATAAVTKAVIEWSEETAPR
jgi:pimeloyl-ACP methyl ester carboxylesterase